MTGQEVDPLEEVEEIDAADSRQDVVADADPPKYSDDDANEARMFGWKSPDEWEGQKPDWYIPDPTEFLDKRVKSSRVFKTMQEKIAESERASKETARRLQAMYERSVETQKAAHEQKLAEIVARQRAAVDSADPDEFDRVEAERRKHVENAPRANHEPQPGPQQIPPEVVEYRASEKGQWLNNPILHRTAAELIDARPDIQAKGVAAQLEFAETEIRRMYPAYFPAPQPPKSQPRQVVDAGGLAGGSRHNTAFQKLPSDAKSQFAAFVKSGIFKDTNEDKEFYANEYNAV